MIELQIGLSRSWKILKKLCCQNFEKCLGFIFQIVFSYGLENRNYKVLKSQENNTACAQSNPVINLFNLLQFVLANLKSDMLKYSQVLHTSF